MIRETGYYWVVALHAQDPEPEVGLWWEARQSWELPGDEGIYDDSKYKVLSPAPGAASMSRSFRDLHRIRDDLRLTTKQLADLVGVTVRTAERWLAGTRKVPEPVWRLLEASPRPAVIKFDDIIPGHPDLKNWQDASKEEILADLSEIFGFIKPQN